MASIPQPEHSVNPSESSVARRRRLRANSDDDVASALRELRSALLRFKSERSTPAQAKLLTSSVEPALDCLTRALHRSDVIRALEVTR